MNLHDRTALSRKLPSKETGSNWLPRTPLSRPRVLISHWMKWVMPLARPVLVTLAIFMFMSAWNDFMWPLIVLTDSARYTLPVAVANLVGEHVQDTELMMASSVLTVLPVLILFLALQRHYIAGIMVGSVKG